MEKILIFLILTTGLQTALGQNIANCQDNMRIDDSVTHSYCDSFQLSLMQNNEMDYNTRTTLLFESPCWRTGVLDSDFFVLLFNYMIVDKRNNEEFSESLSYNLYGLFTINPNIIPQFEYHIKLIRDEYQKELWNDILSSLLFEAISQNEKNDRLLWSEEDFFKIFPSFYNNDNIGRIHKIIENYYEK